MKPTLYYQTDENKIPIWPFCASAMIGARDAGIETIPFYDILHTPYNENIMELYSIQKDPYNIVIGSVETTTAYLERYIPAIDRKWASAFEKRDIKTTYINGIRNYPVFIKPAITIKDFTGLIANDKTEAVLFSKDCKQPVLISEPIYDIESEYRVYISTRGIIGIKHYLGDPYITPDKQFVEDCYIESKKHLKELSYTLDFGIRSNGETFLIEINDGWSIGNYGLEPLDYYHFVKNRFLQLTGVLK